MQLEGPREDSIHPHVQKLQAIRYTSSITTGERLSELEGPREVRIHPIVQQLHGMRYKGPIPTGERHIRAARRPTRGQKPSPRPGTSPDEVHESDTDNLPKPTWDEISHESRAIKKLVAIRDTLRLYDGILHRVFHKDDGKSTREQLVLPRRMMARVFTSLHDDAGQFGRDKTLANVQSRFYWYVHWKYVEL